MLLKYRIRSIIITEGISTSNILLVMSNEIICFSLVHKE